MVKVQWQHYGIEEATWELESEMRSKYLNLFSQFCCPVNFKDEIFIREVGCNAGLKTADASRNEASARIETSTDA